MIGHAGGRMRTRNLDEAIDAVSKVYCPHAIEIVGPARNIDAVVEVAHPKSHPLVAPSHSTAVKIDAGNLPQLFLMMHCARGSQAFYRFANRFEDRGAHIG